MQPGEKFRKALELNSPLIIPGTINAYSAKLAERAKKTGVMQAAPGTEQGKTGWYIDSSGELTSWLVSDDGTWTRIS